MLFPTEIFDSIGGPILLTSLVFVICLPVLFKFKGVKSFLRYIKNRSTVRSFLAKQKKKIKGYPNIERKDLLPEDIGMVPPKWEYDLEKLHLESHCDGIHFAGVNADKESIDICINKIDSSMALVWVTMKLADGSLYKLPSDDCRSWYVDNPNMFSCGGLQIKCLSPFRRWRISFNGLLRKQIGENKSEVIHAKFSFVWLAMSSAQEQNFSYTVNDIADGFSRANHKIEDKDLERLHGMQNRYEQWGQMLGTMTFKGKDPLEMNFWSIRTRIMDTPSWKEDIRCARFYMYFMDGYPLKIENFSIKNTLLNLTSGFTVSPYGGIQYIKKCDLDIRLIENMINEIDISFIAEKNEKKTARVLFSGDPVALHIGPDLEYLTTWIPFSVQMEGCDEGYGILHYTVRSRGIQGEDFKHPPLILKDPGYSFCEKFILPLEDKLCSSSLIAGGKGSSLALLTKLSQKTQQFTVPKGFVVTTTAFKAHVKSNKTVSDAISKLQDVSCRKVKGDVKTECEKCTKTFIKSKLSDHLKNEIRNALLESYDSLENIRFSVRSSAFGEDSEDLSAAGQMLTVLGVRGIDNVCRAVVECWSSKYGFEAVQYVRQNGQSLQASMAVVIQEMVPSEFSGVMFTVDPVTGDPSHPYITANFGLGETVVSALADPDTVVLKRNEGQFLEVYQTNIGSKKTQVFMKGDGVEQKNYDSQSESSCLTDEWALKIGEAGILIESCFCGPRDIEWAVHQNKLYLLQARPITTLHTETDFELIHDQDTPVLSVYDYWTRANTGEVFLGATSPLGLALVAGGMDAFNHKNLIIRERRRKEFSPYYFHILPTTHRQVCLNIVDMLFRSNQKEITAVQRAFEVALFGRPVITEEMHRAGIRKYGYATALKRVLGIIFVPMFALRLPGILSRIDKKISEYRLPLAEYTSAQKTFDGIMIQYSICSEAFGVHGMSTFLSSYFNMMLMTILAKQKKVWDTELYCDFATMLSSCTEVESAGVPEQLQELAKTIAIHHGPKFSSLSSDAAYDLLRNDSEACGKLFEEFLRNHGHRCVKEFDLYSKSWGMQPESLIPTLQNMVSTSASSQAITKEILTTEQILSKIKTPLSSSNKRMLKFLIPLSRKYVGQREKTKSMLIKTVDWQKKSCNHLGQLMVKEGMLPESDLVFFMTLEEIKEVLDSQKPGIVPKAVRRMRLHSKLNELKLPEIMKGIPRPIHDKPDLSIYKASFTLKGTPVCQGQVKARAVVVTTLNEASQIKNGDILITHATDIGWSPYFPLISGVVTVLGGLISHGAVIAREFGLPCVVGVENATVAFKSGDIVILNGTEGTVTKILDSDT